MNGAVFLLLPMLGEDVRDRKAPIEGRILNVHRPIILVGEVVAEGIPTNSNNIKNMAKAAGCRHFLVHHHAQWVITFLSEITSHIEFPPELCGRLNNRGITPAIIFDRLRCQSRPATKCHFQYQTAYSPM
jgi:hypothetical protein